MANRLARVGAGLCSVDGDGWLVLDPAPALHLDVRLYPAGIDRHALRQFRSDDAQVRTIAVGTVDLDPAQPRSEHHLVVGGPRR